MNNQLGKLWNIMPSIALPCYVEISGLVLGKPLKPIHKKCVGVLGSSFVTTEIIV